MSMSRQRNAKIRIRMQYRYTCMTCGYDSMDRWMDILVLKQDCNQAILRDTMDWNIESGQFVCNLLSANFTRRLFTECSGACRILSSLLQTSTWIMFTSRPPSSKHYNTPTYSTGDICSRYLQMPGGASAPCSNPAWCGNCKGASYHLLIDALVLS